MTELLTSAQMRATERAAIESGQVTGLELMERAGRGVVEVVFEEWPELARAPHRALVLCGPGNNGGDGFVVARVLKDWGWEVEVFLYGDPAKLPPDAKANYQRWCAMGKVADPVSAIGDAQQPDLIVDAVFGTGLTRPVEGGLAQVLSTFDSFRALKDVRTVAVDISSGLCADSGRTLGTYASADLTVSFHSAKPGHYLSRGAQQAGRLRVRTIGLEGRPDIESVVRLADGMSGMGLGKAAVLHKYSHGHALILSGGAGKTGAARLAARGALRIGAGLVTLGVPGAAQMEVAGQITALMLRRVDSGAGLAEVLEDDRLNALCLGPGLGGERARDLVPVALCAGHGPGVVLDADALTAFQDDPKALFAMLHGKCVLTPHAGEFARLFPDIAEKLNAVPAEGPAYSKVDATRDAAQRAGCTVLFKGADTVIAAPDGRCSINSAQYDRAAPWLATAGSGDVLAGFITGLMARGFSPMQAAEAAAWLHVEAARSFGPGLIAEDLPEELPKVFRKLGL
ncbi:NAD(P)H-hydrate dehydratase [Roseovarius sp. MMSF_3281]|uniref:NAD(P)H-hydrate dehydratase n=1 Tax=Roseovarius sp. MMSF_3281 TaxID=3046694 RepID=UPI00273F63AF|nr:NAD(P)H-hydrate dehydratase [Roseovarius sp. MMSF_3281]